MTVELSHPVIWESLPRLVPPRGSQTGQHAPTCLSRTSCRLPPCQWAPVKVIACRDGLYGSHQCSSLQLQFELEMWYSYCFQAHIRAVQLRPVSTCHTQLCHQSRAKAAYKAMPSSGSLTLCADQPACRAPCATESCLIFFFFPRWAL